MPRLLLVCLAVFLGLAGSAPAAAAQGGEREYNLTIGWKEVNFSGRTVKAMAVNGSIPGPGLRFREGETAVIRVTNRLDVPSSIHWHGVLVPPGMDGVPYVSYPPIGPGETFTYRFKLRQSGTYWYHSHTHLQEQRGVYGGLAIEPAHGGQKADADQIVVLSDWSDRDPASVLRALRRGGEWPSLLKGRAQSILGAASLGRLGDYFRRELLRMPAMDLADAAYDRFLANGKQSLALAAKPGQLLRLRLVNGSAGSYFYLDYAGGDLAIIAADGQPVQKAGVMRLLIAVAETYDLLLRAPARGAWQLRATAQDGSAHASIWLGRGRKHYAPPAPNPDLYAFMARPAWAKVFALTPAGSMGMADSKVEAGAFDQPGMAMHGMETGGANGGMAGMEPKGKHSAAMEQQHGGGHATPAMKMPAEPAQPAKAHQRDGHATPAMKMPAEPAKPAMAHGQHGGEGKPAMEMAAKPARPAMAMYRSPAAAAQQPPIDGKSHALDFRPLGPDAASAGPLAMEGGHERPGPPYARLRSPHPTAFAKDRPRRVVRLTLDGDMERYLWSFNNKVLAESDDIRIKMGEVVRFVFINRTMMHHPLHLHGHFFRVLNGQGDHAPLKHTVDVAPMSTTVIEFQADEKGDWLFHCHLLYHMMSGMTRVVRYQGYDPGPAVTAIAGKLYEDPWEAWAAVTLLSHMTEGRLAAANARSTLELSWEGGWQRVADFDWEVIASYGWYLNRFASLFAGADLLGDGGNRKRERAVAGFKYLLPLNIGSRFWMDSDLGARLMLDKEFQLTPRLALFGEAQFDSHTHWEEAAGLRYMVSESVSLVGKWHSEYGWGAGLRVSF